jgi:alcohol dehydrogenase (cytochrome c)
MQPSRRRSISGVTLGDPVQMTVPNDVEHDGRQVTLRLRRSTPSNLQRRGVVPSDSTAVRRHRGPTVHSTSVTRFAASATLAVTMALVGSTIAASSAVATPKATASWAYPNGDLANTRVAQGSGITQKNVNSLKVAWTFKLKGKAAKSISQLGSLAMTPIVVGDVVYVQDLRCNVYALSLTNGSLLWEYSVNKPELSGPGPNGVAVANGVVYGFTPTVAFALSATTGKALWVNKKILKRGQGSFGIQPQVANGRVYGASQYGSGKGGGILFALNAATGTVLWRFNTLKKTSLGVTSLGLGAGGAWETPLVGSDGSVTFGTGNPYQTLASATKHPATLLYTDSEVNLNAATGKLRWYYQAEPNDFKDFDMQASPIATTINGRPVIVGGGKMGIVYAMSATSGALLWKTPVGLHNGHDNDSLNLLDHAVAPKLPLLFLPGSFGGILTNMALDGDTVYVSTLDLELEFSKTGQVDGVAPKHVTADGEIEALDLSTGKVEWDTKVTQLPLGAMTVVNDLVFTTLFDGELIALSRTTGAIVYRSKVPDSTNAAIAVAGNTIIVPAGGPKSSISAKTTPQVVAYRLGG